MFEPNEAYHTEGFEFAPAGASAADAGIATRSGALRRDRRACAGRTAELGATRVARIFLRNGFLARSSSAPTRHAIREMRTRFSDIHHIRNP
jgi:hypothetical protein